MERINKEGTEQQCDTVITYEYFFFISYVILHTAYKSGKVYAVLNMSHNKQDFVGQPDQIISSSGNKY